MEHSVSSDQPSLTPEELAAEGGAELPRREAMSLIPTDPTALPLHGAGTETTMPGSIPTGTEGGGDPLASPAGDAADIAGDAGSSEGGVATDQDTSGQYNQQDSAHSQT